MKDLAFILNAYDRQDVVLFLVDGRVWEGVIESCLLGTVAAVVRPVGNACSYTQRRWHLDEIADMSLRAPEGDEEAEDELLVGARRMIEQAREYGEMSLAERLLAKRTTREEQHGCG